MSAQSRSAQPRKVVHSDIKPERARARLALRPRHGRKAGEFPASRSRCSIPTTAASPTALFKLAPGAVVPLHEHTALEQTFVLEGTIEDHEGACGPGQFVWRPAGNRHEAVAPNGALILGFFLKPNRFAYGEKFFTEEMTK